MRYDMFKFILININLVNRMELFHVSGGRDYSITSSSIPLEWYLIEREFNSHFSLVFSRSLCSANLSLKN